MSYDFRKNVDSLRTLADKTDNNTKDGLYLFMLITFVYLHKQVALFDVLNGKITGGYLQAVNTQTSLRVLAV